MEKLTQHVLDGHRIEVTDRDDDTQIAFHTVDDVTYHLVMLGDHVKAMGAVRDAGSDPTLTPEPLGDVEPPQLEQMKEAIRRHRGTTAVHQ